MALAILLLSFVSADTTTTFCQGILECYDNGVDVQGQPACNCTMLSTNGDSQYLGGLSTDKGLSTRSLTLAEGVINLSTSFPYAQVNITNATLNLNHHIAGTLDFCYLQYSTDSGTSWTNLRTCTTDSTPADYIFDLSDLNQTQLENLQFNNTALRSGGAVYAYTRLDYVNLSIEFSEIEAPELPAQQGDGNGGELYSVMESSGAGIGIVMQVLGSTIPRLLIPIFFVVVLVIIGLAIARILPKVWQWKVK